MAVASPPPAEAPSADHVEARVPDGQLGTRVSRGLGWSLVGQVLSRIGTFAAGVVLARLLVPLEMGEVAAGLLVTSVAMAINELGVIPALVRWEGDLRAAAGTAATLALAGSAASYAVAFLAAPWVAALTGTPGSVWVIRVMALTVLVDGAIAVPLAMLYRHIRTVPQMLAEVGGMALYALVSVGLASAGAGGAAIAWGRVAGAVATGAVMVAVGRWPSAPSFDRGLARQLLGFGLPLALSTGVLEAVMNVDYLVVGGELDGAMLGIYLLAFNLSSWPVSVVAVAVARVSFSGFAALIGDPARFRRGVHQSLAVALTATLPLVAVLVVLAPETVSVVYGDTWDGAVAPLRWLLVIGGLRVVLQLVGEVIAVTGRPGTVLRLRLLWLVALPVPLLVGARVGGLSGVAAAHVVVGLVLITPLFCWELARSGVPLRPLVPLVRRPAVATVAAVAAMLAASPLVPDDAVRIVVLGAIGTATYLAVVVPGNAVVATTLAQLRGRRSDPAVDVAVAEVPA